MLNELFLIISIHQMIRKLLLVISLNYVLSTKGIPGDEQKSQFLSAYKITNPARLHDT